MEVIKVKPRGFCKGVVRAISIVKQTAKEHPNEKIYILGMLVHNTYVQKALEAYHVVTLDDTDKSRLELLDEIDEGIVIFTAHGVSDKVRIKAQSKGLTCIDASCLDVLKTKKIVMDKINEGYEIFYIGKKGHPEAIAVCEDSQHIHLITSIADLEKLKNHPKIFVTNQTTMSIKEIASLFDAISIQFPQAVFSDELCDATRMRQEAIEKLEGVDALIVVGDAKSNNTAKLAQIAKNKIHDIFLIDDVNGLDIEAMQRYERVAITAGASTPTYLVDQVYEALLYDKREKQVIDLHRML